MTDRPTPTRARERVAAHGRVLPIVLLAAVLSLDTADRSTLSAAEAQLERGLGIGPAVFGVLAAATPVVGLVLSVPFGMLVDRVSRTRLLAVAVLIWAAAEVVVAVAPSFPVLLAGRAALGVVLAAIPAVASLAGDCFPVARRARDYGYVLSGELLGTGVGFVGTGALAQAANWRWGFAALALCGVAVAALAWWLPEPARGAQRAEQGADDPEREDSLQHQVLERGTAPSPDAVLARDPARAPLREVLSYVLRVRSNRALIVASSLTYLFLSGVQTFALRFGSDQLGLAGAGATAVLMGLGASAILGVLVTGRLADRLVRGGRLDARMLVTAAALVVALVCFVPGTLVSGVAVAVPLLLIGAAALGGSNAPLDAARLDVLHHHAWGRAESVRSSLRLVAYAAAPVAVGGLVTVVGVGPAFTVLAAALAVAAVLMLIGRRSYLGDVAAAGHTASDEDDGPPTSTGVSPA